MTLKSLRAISRDNSSTLEKEILLLLLQNVIYIALANYSLQQNLFFFFSLNALFRRELLSFFKKFLLSSKGDNTMLLLVQAGT